jgi:predicted DNA-binding transcriptional regulator AlpA
MGDLSSTALQFERGLFDNKIDGRYLSSAELAAFLGLSEHTIRAWRKFRIITPIKLGRSVRWLLKEVLEELTKRRSSR